jgi:hypothetical protein
MVIGVFLVALGFAVDISTVSSIDKLDPFY